MTGRRGGKRQQLLENLKEKKIYCKWKYEALDNTLWRIRFGRSWTGVGQKLASHLRRLPLLCLWQEQVYVLILTDSYGNRPERPAQTNFHSSVTTSLCYFFPLLAWVKFYWLVLTKCMLLRAALSEIQKICAVSLGSVCI